MTHEKSVLPFPTQKEFLGEVQKLCKEWEWEKESDPAFVIGAIIECMIEKDEKVTFEAIVNNFYFIRAEGKGWNARDPEGWKKMLFSRSDKTERDQ